MSRLVLDILKRAQVPEKRIPKRVINRAKPRAPRKHHKAVLFSRGDLHLARVPGLSRYNHGWRVCVWDRTDKKQIGTHPTMVRAFVAWRLANYWIKKGFSVTDIPGAPRRTRF